MAVSAETKRSEDGSPQQARFASGACSELVPQTLPEVFLPYTVVTWKYRKACVTSLCPVTVWLMIMQRLSGGGGITWRRRYPELVNGNGWDALGRCKRVRDHSISTSTGGFSQARMQVPVEAARRVSQQTFDQLGVLRKKTISATNCFCWTAVRWNSHTKEISEAYGLAKISMENLTGLSCALL